MFNKKSLPNNLSKCSILSSISSKGDGFPGKKIPRFPKRFFHGENNTDISFQKLQEFATKNKNSGKF